MEVTIKRIDPTLDLPKYQTSGSVFFDLPAREATRVEPGKVALMSRAKYTDQTGTTPSRIADDQDVKR